VSTLPPRPRNSSDCQDAQITFVKDANDQSGIVDPNGNWVIKTKASGERMPACTSEVEK
jgi:hypothetical protein